MPVSTNASLPKLVKHASRFEIMMGLQRGYTVIEFSDRECGLYISGLVNDFDTPLAARGPRCEIEALVAELRR